MQADYRAFKFLIFINKRFFNILVKHVILGIQVTFCKFYSILNIFIERTMY